MPDRQRDLCFNLTGQGYLTKPCGKLGSSLVSILALLLFLAVLVLAVLAFIAVLALLPVLPAVGEARVAQTGADGQDAPVVHVLHERHFGETLHHGVIVHQDRGIVLADPRDRLDQARRQIEFAALPPRLPSDAPRPVCPWR